MKIEEKKKEHKYFCFNFYIFILLFNLKKNKIYIKSRIKK